MYRKIQSLRTLCGWNGQTNESGGVLTLSLGADQAGWGVTERAQDGSDGQAQVLVARVQSDRGEAQVRQAGRFLRTDLHMRDLTGEERRGGRRRKTERNQERKPVFCDLPSTLNTRTQQRTKKKREEKRNVNKEDPLEMLRVERRDRKDAGAREQKDLEIKGYGKKGENS